MYKTERNSIKRFAILKILNQTKNSNLLEWSTIVAEAVNGPKMPSKSQCRFSPRPNFGDVEARVRHHTRGREGQAHEGDSEVCSSNHNDTGTPVSSQRPPQASEQQNETAGGRFRRSGSRAAAGVADGPHISRRSTHGIREEAGRGRR
ncbi:hypothetical protein quinque_013599 [Culex quinquefasciatus]